MKTTRTAVIAVATLALGTALAQAQYSGPSTAKSAAAPHYSSVADVIKQPVDDARLVLQGKLIRKVGKEKYLFSDGTGEIRVEIEEEDFPAVNVDANTNVRIEGEVEKEFLQSPEIDVKRITVSGNGA